MTDTIDTTTPAPAAAATGPITLQDVRAAVGDTDPGKTNVNKLRQILGRGSFATIQQHLNAIRAELLPPPVAPGAVPPPPADAVTQLWTAAYSAAQVQVLGRLEMLAAQRDIAQAQAQQLQADIQAMALDFDTLTESLATAQATALTAAAIEAKHAAQLAAHVAELEKVKADAETAAHAAEQAANLAARDAQIAAVTMQSALETQINKYLELKEAISRLQPPSKPTKTTQAAF